MKITIRTNLDLTNANQSALTKISEAFNGFKIIPEIESTLMLDNIIVRVCAVTYEHKREYHKPRTEEGYHIERLSCEIEVTVPKNWNITRFQEIQNRTTT